MGGGHELDKPQTRLNQPTSLSSLKFTAPGIYLSPLGHLASIRVLSVLTKSLSFPLYIEIFLPSPLSVFLTSGGG